jgi:hypothetical protein
VIFESHDYLETVHFFELGLPPREPPRPVTFREPDYLDRFDHQVMAYDFIRMGDGRVFGICPDLSMCSGQLAATRIQTAPGAAPRRTLYGFDRHSRLVLQDVPADAALQITGPGGERAVYPGSTRPDLFAGRRCLLTISKNNRIDWIVDWVEFHVRTAGADALLLYDNGTTLFAPAALAEALRGSGLAVLVVVRWPFKWGPLGYVIRHRRRHWDSNFGQIGMFEHARWRYLAQARAVLNLDVDELAVSNVPGSGVFDLVEADAGGYLCFEGLWVEHAPTLPSEDRRHRAFLETNDPPSASPSKWGCVPARIPEGVNWATHALRTGHKTRFRGDRLTEDVVFYHFRGVTSGWKAERKKSLEAERDIPRRRDPRLHAAYAAAGWV